MVRIPRLTPLPNLRLPAILTIVVLVSGYFGWRVAAVAAVSQRIQGAAHGRGLTASWQSLTVGFPARIAISGLALVGARSDTAFRAESLTVTIDPWSLLIVRPRAKSLSLTHARLRMSGAGAADPDTLAPEEPRRADRARRERSEAVRSSAEHLASILLAPARGLPSLTLRDVAIESARKEDVLFGGAQLGELELRPDARGIRLVARGTLLLGRAAPFELTLDYGRDDRIAGSARFLIPTSGKDPNEPLDIAVTGRVSQDHHAGVVRLGESSRVTIGDLPVTLSGSVWRGGPRVQFSLAADQVTQKRVTNSLPRAILGPLLDLSVRGSFDYRLAFDLDLAHPAGVDFMAEVIPHGLRLDPAGTRLNLLKLAQPFTAVIHLPRGVIATRELSPANLHFRTLDHIDSLLSYAVVTNEDGGFFRHRGFNVWAVKMAIADNLKAGAYRRGAGTITMQLVRNLYLGHEKTLSRKGQEVALAWVLEHLTGIGKQRLLEIYLNIIEWGPGVHGADEAAWYYFDHDAERLTVSEALFLSTVVPSPNKWHYRFGRDGQLKPFERAQMHFIGRAMIAKGWLPPDALPPADSLRVELKGPARAVISPAPDSLHREPKDEGAPPVPSAMGVPAP